MNYLMTSLYGIDGGEYADAQKSLKQATLDANEVNFFLKKNTKSAFFLKKKLKN